MCIRDRDIQRMSRSGKLAALTVVMKKHPDSLFPVEGSAEFKANEAAKIAAEEIELFRGSVRELAGLFPVNVNTICTAALAAGDSVGFDTKAVLIADSRLDEMVIDVLAEGPPTATGGRGMRVRSIRENPSKRGEVTGQATLMSFFSSLRQLCENPPRGNGIHLC
eukprot:TRINITY_DN60926_c0_g1_i2.p2 TRINITY_DN60926_c0_g1~~TRINITY_DN60926_c0_g1_i2.p2  ORF type:complete len:165 (-),score=56.27 TRINITY_DN60926_c0_g1_i2:291-785(-)